MASSRASLPRAPARSRRRRAAASSRSTGARRAVLRVRKPRLQFEWAETISTTEWRTYQTAIRAIRAAGIPFLLGGGFALAIYTGRWRDTKDIDFYILKRDRRRAIAALTRAGFQDYFQKLRYDRKWIYRSHRSGVIVDIIWAMANQRAQVDGHWFEGAAPAAVRMEPLLVVPMEEFIWCKLYIMQRDHCDWTDIFNLLYAGGERVDWNHLFRRLDGDQALLKGLLCVYGWLCPRLARRLPRTLYQRLGLSRPEPPKRTTRDRIRLLDSRAWFAAQLPPNRPLDI